MRKSKQEALEIEMAEAKRRSDRKNGYSLMEIRDRGWVRFENGSVMEWPVDRELLVGEARRHIPKGHFFLDGKMFDVDEFRKYERWV